MPDDDLSICFMFYIARTDWLRVYHAQFRTQGWNWGHQRHLRACGALVPALDSDTGTNVIFSAQDFLTILTRHDRLGVSLILQLKPHAVTAIAMSTIDGSTAYATVPATHDIVSQRFLTTMMTRDRVAIDPPWRNGDGKNTLPDDPDSAGSLSLTNMRSTPLKF